jgi:hypothetical protein
MKKFSLVRIVFCLLTAMVFSGCVAAIGNRTPETATVGQQLVDLQKAKESGAISEAEFEMQKAKILGAK